MARNVGKAIILSSDKEKSENKKKRNIGNAIIKTKTNNNVAEQAANVLKTADLNSLQTEIDSLQSILDTANSKKVKTNTLNKKGVASARAFEQRNVERQDLNEYLKSVGFESIKDIEEQLIEKKAYKGKAQRVKDNIRLSSVANPESENYDADFEKYAIKGAALADENNWAESTKNIIAKWRNNPAQLKSWEKAKNWFNGAIGESVLNNQLTYLAAKYMTDDEFAIYNYYLAKETDGLVEKGTADKYLKSIQDTLTDRQGKSISKDKESAVSQYSYGYKVGMDQFTQGLINRFNTQDDYIPATGIQKASAQIRSQIKERDGIIGQIGYDMINTTSNMLPSVLTSTAIGLINPTAGAVVGAGLMGASASGNAYQEMLNLGYDKKQANTYSILVGASEAALSYAFGGISKLGGKLTGNIIEKAIAGIDNGIAKFAIEFGIKIGSEGLEEAAQEVLAPLFENIALGYDKNGFEDINWAEVAYSGLLGMLSSVGFSAVESADSAAKRNYNKDTSFAKQVDDVISGTHNTRYDLYVSKTPKIFTDLGFSDTALLMRNGKVKEILKKHPDMSVDIIKQIPKAIQNPILILKSKTHPTESVVAITDVLTDKGNMIIPVWINQEGNYVDIDLGFDVVTDTNFVASAYGRNVKSLLEYANENDGFLYQTQDIEKVRQLIARNGLQLPTPLKLSDSDITIPQNDTGVNNIISNEGDNNSSNSDTDIILPENIKEISIANKNKQRHHTTLKEQNYIIGIGKALGRTVVFENVVNKLRAEGIDLKGQIPDGYIDNDNVIHMNFTVIDPLTFIFKHELTHFGEGTEAYNKFVDAVRKSDAFKNWLIEKTGLNAEDNTVEVLIAAARQSVMDSRTGDGTVDVDGAMAEVIADFVGDCLFTDNGSGLESMLSNLNVKERNAVIQYILDFLSYIKKKLAGYKDIEFEISRLEDSFNRMLSEATQAANQGDLKTEGNRYTFARSYDTDAIAEAEDIESQGAKYPEIWGKTGLMRDGGGTWVYEIDDFEMEFDPKGHVLIKEDPDYEEFVKLENKADDPSKKMTKRDWERLAELDDKFFLEYGYGLNKIEEYVKHDKLFEVYPQLKDIKIEFRDLGENGYGGYYSHSEKKIVINEHSLNSKDPNRIKKTLIHELQHAVQYIDGREEGSNKEFWNARILNGERMPINYRTGRPYTAEETYDAYLDTAGEMEARVAAERFDYTEKERGYGFFAPEIDYNNSIKRSEFSKETVPTAMAEGYIEAVNSNDINTAQRLVDQAAKKSGYTERLYHQTGKEFTEFNTNNQIAGKYDWELPAGTFLKPSNNDIGLSGKKQMELYAKFENALVFKNRSEARSYWIDNIPGYKRVAQEMSRIDTQYRRKTDEAMDDVHQYLKEWRQKNPSIDSREIYKDSEYQRLNDLEDEIVDEWEQKSNEASLRAKQLLNDYISKSDFDGIIIEKDEGSYGRTTKTYIAFDSSQLKDASPVTYDDNGDVISLSARFDSNKKDIRYSIPRGESVEKYDEQQYNDFGWTKHNGILSNKAFNLLTEKIAEIKHGGSFHKSKYGEYIIPVGDESGIYNILVYTDDNMESPHIRKVIKINAEDTNLLNIIRSYIFEYEKTNESSKGEDAFTIVRDFYGPENIAQYTKQDCPSFRQYSREQERVIGSENHRGDREWSNGRKTSSNSKGIQINKFSIPSEANSLLDRYESGEISREDYQQQLDELWKSANEEYGTIKQGENAKTPLAVPKAVKDGMPTKQFVRTVIETGKLTSEMIEDIEQEVLLGDIYSYKVVSDESARNKAEKSFEKGIAEESWNKAISTRIISKEDIAIGEKLLLQAIENNERLKVVELSAELSDALTRSGQVVQAARMLKKMSGIGRLVTAQKNVKTINKSLQEKYGDKAPTVKLNPLLAEQLAKTKTTREIEMVYGEVLSDIASQVPATWLDKLNAWRYFAMLSNPRTHIRNLVSNTVFTPSIMLKRFIATGAEHILIKDADKRTKAVFIKKEYMDFAKKDIKNREVKNMLQGKGQLDDKAIIEELRKTFETKWLESLTKSNTNLLEAEDMWFKSHHYKVAFASFLQARKVNLKSVSENTLQEAREYAVKEAKKATFQDVSKLANWLNNIKNPVGRIAVEGVLPFKRTPINIIKRGVEYSPIGLMEKLTVGLLDVRKGKITVSEFCDGLAAGITGTGFVAIGWILASAGMVVGSSGDDEEDKFKQLNGEQEYAVQIFDKSYTVDWAAPAAIPFFIGVELAGEIDENDGFEFKDLTDSFWNALEPITNLSMLSGVQGLIETVKYEDSSKTIGTMIGDVATNFAMQLIPSSFGAIARTIDETQRTWYTDKNSSLDSFSQSVINNVKSKVPGLSYTQIPKIDAWGREVKRGSVGERIAENFISPGYYSEVDYSEAEKELKRLWKSTGENVFPKTAAKYFQVNGETKHLTADEYVEYAKAKGEYSFDYIKEFVNGSAYDKLADSEKAEVIKNLYEYANAKAKTEVSDYDIMKQYKTVTNWERNGKSAVVYYISKAIN